MSQHRDKQLTQILTLLAQGQFLSGQHMAEKLSVSRAYIWKLIQQLQELGLSVESVTRKGYRLSQSISLLDEAEISKTSGFDCQLLLTTDSTNTRLKNDNFGHEKLIIAEHQSAGRGRRGRQWLSPLASNLYWSLGWKTALPIQQLGGLSLVIGLAICHALSSFGLEGIELKWPNDIRYQGKKIGGILIEFSGDATGDLHIIIGVGLNVTMTREAGQQIDQEWISLASIAEQQGIELPSRQQLLCEILNSKKQSLSQFETKGFQSFIQQWETVDEAFSKKVTIMQTKQNLHGIGAGVDETGAFLLQTGKGIIPIYAGEVSLRFR